MQIRKAAVIGGGAMGGGIAHVLARTIAAKSRLAVSAAIDAASEGLDVSLEEGIDIEIDNFARVTISKDAKEGTDAFQNKRKAAFRDM
ncbi:MAG TPA: enoyl-CoA hydratase-related protein [Desulfomonilia bacterium]|jgi:enoyl-CoA hydratase|nr:enoyl-CoA hydratase-related protein [Desulfomonilia bacterium]